MNDYPQALSYKELRQAVVAARTDMARAVAATRLAQSDLAGLMDELVRRLAREELA